jgi:uncharacterized protein YyaL (SSP411 family)
MSNRLAGSQSDYLLQHRDNPVDWWPWGPDAFAEARRLDRPVLLSVGYAACHWCHVMAHESFEDPRLAAVLNGAFVAIKVDREERPDVDAVYMQATQAMTGSGGWPMTCFLTPDAQPFFCGTYFPPSTLGGMPGFGDVLDGVSRVWRERRADLLASAAELTASLQAPVLPPGSGPARSDRESLDDAVAGLLAEADRHSGGFGGAPKFPPSMVCEFLLRAWARTGSPDALAVVDQTFTAMARGGLNDALAGGFARYSVDASWVVPHFEKMLYDNAQLLRLSIHRAVLDANGGAATRELAERVARETAAFLLRDLRTAEGGFASSLDADAAGREGSTYVWTPAELVDVLGPVEGPWAAAWLGVGATPTFEGAASVLQRRADPADPGERARLDTARALLLDARALRPQPARDEKVVAAWNGLAIGALAEAGAVFDEPSWVSAATVAAQLVLDVHLDGTGRLRRTSRAGLAGASAGVLEDHGCLAEGLLVLGAVTGDPRWTTAAGRLLDTVLDRFADADGVLSDTAVDAEILISRPRDPTDNASPSGTAAAAGALLAYGSLTGSGRHLDAADHALAAARALAGRAPRFAGWGLAVLEAAVAGPVQIAVVGPAGDDRRAELHRAAIVGLGRGAVVAVGDPADRGPADPAPPDVPLLAGRGLVAGRAAAYVCRGFVCDLPVTTAADLRAQLGR